MYSEEALRAYPFFSHLLNRMDRSALHDSLTGLISRPIIIEFIHSLIDSGTPFALAMVDLDNFKHINDHFGHRMGDKVLTDTAQRLQQFVGGDGVVGRFGGDEFLLVYLKSNAYDDLHDYYDSLYTHQANSEKPIVLRREIQLDSGVAFVTATLGSASFPENADDYDGLFAKMDKALYRGKTKGRNCFIIYVDGKHAHLEIPTLTQRSQYEAFVRMREEFEAEGTAEARLGRAFQAMQKTINMTQLLWIDGTGVLRPLDSGTALGCYPNVEKLMNNGMYAAQDFHDLNRRDPALCECLKGLGMESILLMRVGPREAGYGFLAFCPEMRTMHIWQDAECATAYVLCALLAWYLDGQGRQALFPARGN